MSQSPDFSLRLVFACLGLAFGVLHTSQAQDSFPAGEDNFADAFATSAREGMSTAILFSKTSEPNEPGHRANGDNAAGRSIWWKWVAPETGFCTVDTRHTVRMSNAVLGTSVAIYRGDSLATLTRVAGNGAYSVQGFHADSQYSSVTFRAEAGVTYRIAVDAFRNGVVGANSSNVTVQLRHIPLRKMVRRSVIPMYLDGDIIDVGSVAVTTTATGRLTGKMITTLKSYTFTGSISSDGYFTASFEPPVAKPGTEQAPPMTLVLDMAADGRFILYHNNTLADGEFPETTIIPANTPSPLAGYYTAHVSAGDASLGYMTFTIKGNGSIRGTGIAPDGTAFGFSTALFSQDPEPAIPIHVPLHGKKGGLVLYLYSQDISYLDPEGAPRYAVRDSGGAFVRPPSTKAFYSEGIADGVSASGSTYVPPTPEQLRPFGFLNPDGVGKFLLDAEDEELETRIIEDVILEASGKVTFGNSILKPVVKLNPKTGLITGNITEPGKKKRTLRGVISADDEEIEFGGLTTGTTRNLRFFIFPPEYLEE